MRSHNSEFKDLTKAQVEALQECFDFLRNGYLPIIDFCIDGLWVIKLRHQRKFSMLIVEILRNSYTIKRGGKKIKSVYHGESPERYSCQVDSDLNVRVVTERKGAAQSVISG